MRVIALLSLLFCCALSHAANQIQKVSLKEQALLEARQQGIPRSHATDAQVSGMLQLKNPRPEIITRTWLYFAGFSAQSFQAQGLTQKEGSGSFDLGRNPSTLMPGAEFGVHSPLKNWQSLAFRFGARAKAQFASQGTSVVLSSGYAIDDARLNTTVLSVGPQLSMQWQEIPRLFINVSPQFGSINYTQTSANDFAKFSRNAGFSATSIGADFALNSKWLLGVEWTQRNLNSSNEIALQQDNIELGTKILW